MGRFRFAAATLAAGLLGAFAITAPALAGGPKLYEGHLSLQYFGNNTTAGTQPPFSASVFTALPMGTRCNPDVSGGMTCDPTATLQVGAPLTGSGTALVGGGSPASVALPSGQLGRITSGSVPPHYATEIYRKTYANLANGSGNFHSGGGPGDVYYPAGYAFGARVYAGKNQFGGVMRLLAGAPSAGLGTKVKYSLAGGPYVGDFPTWGATLVGATSNMGIPAAGLVKGTIANTTMTSMMFTTSAIVRGWPWTTGKVLVYAFGDFLAYPGFFPEVLSRSGYDNRTSQGSGTIQLVTPHLTEWGNTLQWAAIGVLRLRFVPEPSSGFALLAGTGLLGALHRRRNRS